MEFCLGRGCVKMVGGIIKKIGKQEDRIGICRVSAENEAVLEEPSPMLTHISNIWGMSDIC